MVAVAGLTWASAATAALTGESVEAPVAPEARGDFTVHELEIGSPECPTTRARVYVPRRFTSPPDGAWPVAILLHGYAQALSARRALAAWEHEYDVLAAYRQLERGEVPSTPALSEQRAQAIRRALDTTPFTGMVLVAPITLVPYFQKDVEQSIRDYSDFIYRDLLPKVAELAPISTAPEHVGLAGVSMGGLVGLELMWRFPNRFGAYCGLEIAIRERDARRFAGLLDRAFEALDPGTERPIRVVTATQDTYRWSNTTLHDALLERGLQSSLELREGAHDAAWMRQAGSLESLLWLDRVLRRSLRPLAPAG